MWGAAAELGVWYGYGMWWTDGLRGLRYISSPGRKLLDDACRNLGILGTGMVDLWWVSRVQIVVGRLLYLGWVRGMDRWFYERGAGI